jgi:hypothetical protein
MKEQMIYDAEKTIAQILSKLSLELRTPVGCRVTVGIGCTNDKSEELLEMTHTVYIFPIEE